MKVLFRILLLCSLILTLPVDGLTEIYKYRDANGRLTFVDDESKVPAQFRDDMSSISEANDSLIVYEKLQEGKEPPRIIYVVIDDTPLPSISDKNKIAIVAKGKRFELVCEEIYNSVLQIPKQTGDIDLSNWDDYVF